jgi:UPF0271 protein
MAARDDVLADAVARAVASVDKHLIFFAPVRSALSRAGQAQDLQIAHEVFADRNYCSDGSLVSRSQPDAMLHDPAQAAPRVLRMLRDGKVRSVNGDDVGVRAETICLHGDNPEAVQFARALRSQLEKEDVAFRSPKFSA